MLNEEKEAVIIRTAFWESHDLNYNEIRAKLSEENFNSSIIEFGIKQLKIVKSKETLKPNKNRKLALFIMILGLCTSVIAIFAMPNLAIIPFMTLGLGAFLYFK